MLLDKMVVLVVAVVKEMLRVQVTQAVTHQ
jgi:hypothetical protein